MAQSSASCAEGFIWNDITKQCEPPAWTNLGPTYPESSRQLEQGYYKNYESSGENGENKGWLQSAISGGAAVISSVFGYLGAKQQAEGQQASEPTGGQAQGQSGFAGLSNQQLLMIIGGGALVWYLAR